MSISALHHVEGLVNRGFEPMRETFADNFVRRRELGGACCAYHRGENVADLWGGVRDKQTGDAWEQDTMVIIYSATKGLAAMTLAIAHSRGWLDYEERVSTYTQVAPVSWLMARGVAEGRKAVNFSEWAGYPPAAQRTLLSASCDAASSGKMPGPYTLLRPETRLSVQDVETICAAARQADTRAEGGSR